jgi:ribosome-associated protein
MSWRRFALPPRPRTATPQGARPRQVPIHTETITLGALLKWAGIVETGGIAKGLIATGHVRVNGEIETRRGRQVISGDTVTIRGGPSLLVTKAAHAPSAPALAPRVS